MLDTKSCFNCAHIHEIYYPQTREEPEFHEWSCGHNDHLTFPYSEATGDIVSDDKNFGEYCAKDCPGWEFKDWPEYYKQQAIAEAELEIRLTASEIYKSLGAEVDYE